MAEITIRFSDKVLRSVGVVMLVLSLLWALIYIVNSGLLEPKYELRVYLAETQGIQVAAPVRLDGVDVGKVSKVNMAASSLGPNHRIELILRIKRRYEDKITADSAASVVSEGLLGNAYVNVSRGVSGIPLSPGQEIQSLHVENISLTDMLEALSKIKSCDQEKNTENTAKLPSASPTHK